MFSRVIIDLLRDLKLLVLRRANDSPYKKGVLKP